MDKLYYSYEMLKNDTQILVNKVRDFEADTLLCVARGGLTLSHLVSQALNNRNLYIINSISYDRKTQKNSVDIFNLPNLKDAKKVLILDDIVDSGKTMKAIIELLNDIYPNIEFKFATLFYKKTAFVEPDFYINIADSWIEFFWEVDIK